MINKIVMKNIASYKAETVLETDKKVNLIYGLNGTGKSTLSSYLYDMTGEPYRECRVEGLGNTDKVLVYNQKFIADNFYETEEIQGMVRNVTAHELRIRWDINENDAIDILQQVSFVHKYMDQCIPVRHLT